MLSCSGKNALPPLRENLHAFERGGGMLKTRPDKVFKEVALTGFNPTVWGCDKKSLTKFPTFCHVLIPPCGVATSQPRNDGSA